MGFPETPIASKNVPRHVAIIMDGNGRWAKERNLSRTQGHEEGAKSVREVVRAARRMGIKALTLFAFSEQNWDRPVDEVSALMNLLYRYLHEERQEILENQIRLTAVGEVARLPGFVRDALLELIEASKHNDQMVLALALSYGGREDLVHAARRIAEAVLDGKLKPAEITEKTIETNLYTAELQPVDLLIRTSGELRISNFMLWQLAYAELLFVPTLWPEFRKEQFEQAIRSYQERERRFGMTSEQVARALAIAK